MQPEKSAQPVMDIKAPAPTVHPAPASTSDETVAAATTEKPKAVAKSHTSRTSPAGLITLTIVVFLALVAVAGYIYWQKQHSSSQQQNGITAY